jgi:hypothetical protein
MTLPAWVVLAKLHGLYERDEQRAPSLSRELDLESVCSISNPSFSREDPLPGLVELALIPLSRSNAASDGPFPAAAEAALTPAGNDLAWGAGSRHLAISTPPANETAWVCEGIVRTLRKVPNFRFSQRARSTAASSAPVCHSRGFTKTE